MAKQLSKAPPLKQYDPPHRLVKDAMQLGGDEDPKGKRSIKPESPKRYTGKADGSNGANLQGAPNKEDVSGAYPEDKINKAYSHVNKISGSSSYSNTKSGQGGDQDL